MKAIVSSKALFDFINTITHDDSKTILISGDKLSVPLESFPDQVLKMVVQKENYDSISCPINWEQLWAVRRLLKQIPEQPVVIEINQYEDDKISIELSQIVATF